MPPLGEVGLLDRGSKRREQGKPPLLPVDLERPLLLRLGGVGLPSLGCLRDEAGGEVQEPLPVDPLHPRHLLVHHGIAVVPQPVVVGRGPLPRERVSPVGLPRPGSLGEKGPPDHVCPHRQGERPAEGDLAALLSLDAEDGDFHAAVMSPLASRPPGRCW